MTRFRNSCRWLPLLALLSFSCTLPPVPATPPTAFQPGDFVRCRSGGGEGKEDLLEVRGDGIVSYQALGSPKRTHTKLEPEELTSLLKSLNEAGMFQLRETPNRALENFGVVLEIRLGEYQRRATIGALQLQKKKHTKWRAVVGILIDLTEQHELH